MVAYESPSAAGAPPNHHNASGGAPQAPPVVLVMVTRNPGPWFEEALAGIASQDYPNLAVLVIDAASERDPLPTVARVLPAAYVRRLEGNPGFGAAANEVLGRVAGAAFFCFCHDDVLLEPDAIRLLVEEAYRSDAGVVGPKIVSWGNRLRLLQVGMTADKTGVVSPLVERGELDQEQHDRVRDVFTIPGGCTLVRADVFETLGGFDPTISFLGEDLDLCWRAQVVGARVVVVPAARVEHLEALGARGRGAAVEAARRRLAARHRLRTMLTCYSLFHLLRVVPQAALVSFGEIVYGLVTGRFSQSRDVAGAWWWNVRRLPEIVRRRHRLKRVRALPDSEVRRLQARGSALLNAFVRGELGRSDHLRTSLVEVGRGLTGSFVGPRRLAAVTLSLVAVLLLIGSRELLFGRLAAVGAFAPIDEGPVALLRDYVSGWRAGGLGSEAPTPTAVGLVGLLGLPLLGQMGLLQVLLVLGALPVGLFGTWRLATPLGSPRARAVAVFVYAAAPVPYAAIGAGRWGALWLYAFAPWLLRRLARVVGEAPFAVDGEAARREPLWRPVLAVGIPLALVAALVPVVVLLVPLVAAALLAGSLAGAPVAGALRAVKVATGAALVAVVLHLPWSLDLLLPGAGWSVLGGVEPLGLDPLPVTSLLRLETDLEGASVLAWAIPVAAAPAVLVGRGWRLVWAARAWFVAAVCSALAWVGGHGLLPWPAPSAELLLAPAAAGLALAAALTVAALEADSGGWRPVARRLVGAVTGAALVVAALPLLGDVLDGRWGAPDSDFAGSLTLFDEVDGSYRVLWVGHPDVLPLGSQRLGDGLAFGVSTGGTPGFAELWPGRPDAGNALVAEAVRLAADGQTQRLGRLLAPLGIRFVAMPERAAPEREGGEVRALPLGARRSVDAQLDLRRRDIDPAIALYENVAWAPVRAQLADDVAATVVAASSLFGPAITLDLSDARAVLADRPRPTRAEGEVGAGTVYVAEAFSDRWELHVDGRVVESTRALGWANSYEVEAGGSAVLRYRTSPLRWLAVALQVVLWAAVLALRLRRPPAPRPSAAHGGLLDVAPPVAPRVHR